MDTPMTTKIELTWDTQTATAGWAYRLYRDGLEVESGGCCDELDQDADDLVLRTVAAFEIDSELTPDAVTVRR